jgi:hypothetical protein
LVLLGWFLGSVVVVSGLDGVEVAEGAPHLIALVPMPVVVDGGPSKLIEPFKGASALWAFGWVLVPACPGWVFIGSVLTGEGLGVASISLDCPRWYRENLWGLRK